MDLKWHRPKSTEYPKIWHRFSAKNKETNEVDEYRVQDLPESRIEDALEFLVETMCKEEPISEAYGLYNDDGAIEELKSFWKSVIKQKMVLVCFKEGSDGIVGLHMNYVVCKNDVFVRDDVIDKLFSAISELWRNCCLLFQQLYRIITFNSEPLVKTTENYERMKKLMMILNNDFNICEHFVVDKYLTSGGLAVAKKYRGRGIGLQLLKTHKVFCSEFGIRLSIDLFTSNYSNAIADKAGYQLQKSMSFDDVRKAFPHLQLPFIRSDVMAIKALEFSGEE